jgi:hypothetical protein
VRTTTIHCDRCRVQIDGPMSSLETAGELAGALPRIDLCAECGRALVSWLRSAEALGSVLEGSIDPAGRCPGEAHSPSRERSSRYPSECTAEHQ